MESLAAVTRVARFLREAEKCRQHYLPVVARGVAWAFTLLLASSLATVTGASIYLLALAAAGYITLSHLIHPHPLPGNGEWSTRRIAVLAAATLLLVLTPVKRVASILGGRELALLLLPTLRRLYQSHRSLGHIAIVPLALLALGASAIIAGEQAAGVELLAAAELALVAVATRRMIECGDTAAKQLLAEGEEGESAEEETPYRHS